MAVTGQQLLDVVCFDLWEDGGLVLGVLTNAQFLDLLNLAILEMCQACCLEQLIQTQVVFGGQPQYPIPNEMMRVDDAFLGGVYLEPSNAADLPIGRRAWRLENSPPQYWHVDELPPKTVELAPVPLFNSSFVPGPNYPAPPNAQTGSFDILDAASVVETPDQHGALTLVGPLLPDPLPDLATPIPVLADDFVYAYLTHGVLARVYSGDNELKDNFRAEWHQAQWQEGLAVLSRVMNEEQLDNA